MKKAFLKYNFLEHDFFFTKFIIGVKGLGGDRGAKGLRGPAMR